MHAIYLMRHGDAEPGIPGRVPDRERQLSDFGRRQALAQGKWLVSQGEQIDEIWHSPFKRAIQTARALHEVGGWPLREDGLLVPSGYVDDWQYQLAEEDRIVLIVSHLPIIDSFQESVTQCFVSFKQATMAKIAVTQRLPLQGTLVFANDAKP